MIPSDVGLWNTGLPLALLALLSVLIPRVLLRKDTRSHSEVAVTIWASAGIMLILSGVTFAVLYAAQGHEVWDRAAQAPLATLWFFMRQAAFAAIVWVPILGLVWFGMAQGVEKRRGQDKARQDHITGGN